MLMCVGKDSLVLSRDGEPRLFRSRSEAWGSSASSTATTLVPALLARNSSSRVLSLSRMARLAESKLQAHNPCQHHNRK